MGHVEIKRNTNGKPNLEQFVTDLKRELDDPDFRLLARQLNDHVPRQSGMEQSHEKMVMELLNFMLAEDIPFYNRDSSGERIKPDKTIEERFRLLKEKLYRERAEYTQVVRDRVEMRAENKQLSNRIADLEHTIGCMHAQSQLAEAALGKAMAEGLAGRMMAQRVLPVLAPGIAPESPKAT